MNIKLISTNAFLADLLCKHSDDLPLVFLKHIAKVVDYDLIPERILVDNEDIRKIIKWDNVNKMKLIRVLVRCLDQGLDEMTEVILPYINKFDYKIKELTHLFSRKPHYIEYFPINLNKITTTEAVSILSLGYEYFLDKINLQKYNFNFRESMDIIKGYNYKRCVIENVNYKSLKGYQIVDIISKTGYRDVDILNTSILTSIDWVNLLEKKPELLNYCDFNKFKNSDIFDSIKLYCLIEDVDLSYLIKERDMSSISPFGWEKLIIKNPDIFLKKCDLNLLNKTNWNNILKFHPHLVNFSQNENKLKKE